jgi:hypothetical protein
MYTDYPGIRLLITRRETALVPCSVGLTDAHLRHLRVRVRMRAPAYASALRSRQSGCNCRLRGGNEVQDAVVESQYNIRAGRTFRKLIGLYLLMCCAAL